MQGPQEHRGPVKPDAPAEDRQHKSGTDDLPPEIGLRLVRRPVRNHDALRPRGTGVRCDGAANSPKSDSVATELAGIGLRRLMMSRCPGGAANARFRGMRPRSDPPRPGL